MADDKNKSSKSTKSSTRTSNAANKEVLDFAKQLNNALSIQTDSQDKFTDAIKESSIYYKDLSKSADQAQKSFNNIKKILKDTKDESKAYLKNMEDVEDLMDDYADLLEDVVENTKNLGSLSYKRIKTGEILKKLESDHLELTKKQNQALEEGDVIGANILEANKQNLESLIAQANQIKKTVELQDKLNEKLKEAGTSIEEMTEDATKLSDSIIDSIKKIPGGSTLSKLLGFGKVQKDIKEKVGGAITESLMKSAEAGKSGMSSMFSSMIAGARAFTAAMLANPIFLIAAIIVGIILLFKKLLDIAYKVDEEVTDIAKGFGVSKDRAKELKHEMLDIGITSKELLVDLEVMNEAYGNITAQVLQINKAGFETAIQDAQRFTYYMGLSTEEAGSLLSVLQEADKNAFNPDKATKFTTALKDGSMQTSHAFEEMMQITESVNNSLGLVGNKRFNLTTMAKLLAGISKTTMAMFKGSTEQLIKANLQMKLLGTNADTMAKVASGLLDIESSVTREYEDRALTGSTINYDQLRFMSLTAKTQKDLANMATYMYNELDKQDLKWQDMTHWQKEARAQALGMGVEEVDAMYKQGKILKQLGTAAGEKLMQHIKDGKLLEDDIANMQKLDKATRDQLMKESEAVSLKQKQDHIMSVMTEKIEANLNGLGSFVESLADIGTRLASGESLFSIMWNGAGPAPGQAEADKAAELEQQQKEAQQAGNTTHVQELDKLIKEQKQQADKEAKTGGLAKGAKMGIAAAIGGLLLGTALDLTGIGAAAGIPMQAASLATIATALGTSAAIGGGIGYATAETPKPTANPKRTNVKDAYFPAGRASAIMGDDGEFYYPNRNDSVLVTTNNIKPTRVNTMTGEQVNSSTNSNSSSETVKLLREQNKLLASLLGAVDQPVKLNLNGIDKEIGNMQSLRKNYGGRISNTYGATHGF